MTACLIAGCATAKPAVPKARLIEKKGIYHKVHAGETLWRIAKIYDVTLDDIIEANKIPNAARIEKNQLIFIPGAKSQKDAVLEKDISKNNDFNWPLKGEIISYFGDQGESWFNRGINIRSQSGESVCAARDGRVVFADYLNGYSDTIILDHNDGFFTVYTQNAALLVKPGDAALKGKPIAKLGKTGNLSFLHFEIRKGKEAANPLYYLP